MRAGTSAAASGCLMVAALLLSRAPLHAQGTNGVFDLVSRPAGVVMLSVPADSEAVLSVPFDPFDSALSSLLHGQLTAATATNRGDLARFWDATSGRYRTYEKVAGDAWTVAPESGDSADAVAEAQDCPSVEMGKGFIVANRQSYVQRIMFGGVIALEQTRLLRLPGGISLVSYPFSSAMPANETGIGKTGALLTGNAFEMAAGYWHVATNDSEVSWSEARPYSSPFSTAGVVRIVQVSCDPARREVTLGAVVAGTVGRKVDVFKRDLSTSDRVGDWQGWTLLASDLLVEPDKPLVWTDRTLSTDPAFKGVRLYAVALADVDLDRNGTPDARQWLCRTVLSGETGTLSASCATAPSKSLDGGVAPTLVQTDGVVGTGARIVPLLWRNLLYVDARLGSDVFSGFLSAVGGSDGPKRTIKAALDSVPAGGTVIVKPGAYKEDLHISGRPVSVRIRGKVALRPDASKGD